MLLICYWALYFSTRVCDESRMVVQLYKPLGSTVSGKPVEGSIDVTLKGVDGYLARNRGVRLKEGIVQSSDKVQTPLRFNHLFFWIFAA